jgi:hypothetical protein
MSIEELKEGEIYSSLNDDGLYIFKCKKSKTTDYSFRSRRKRIFGIIFIVVF